MIPWGSLTLQVFCIFVCRPYLTEAGCAERFNPDFWSTTDFSITYKNFIHVVSLVDADSFEDMIKCTLGNEITKGNEGRAFLEDCMEYEEKTLPQASVSPCREEFKRVSFFDLMCLVANASKKAVHVCSHDSQTDVVVELYSIYHKTPIATTLPTTKEPSTTTKQTTATTKSTTAEQTTKNSPIPTTARSTSSSASSTASQHSSGNTSWNQSVQLRKEAAYPLLGLFALSILINLVLAFCAALLCSQRSRQASSAAAAADRNGYSLESQPLRP